MIEIEDKSKCSGCFSCVSACPKKCITMKIDEEGFWYPFVNKEKCIGCGLCEAKCPIIKATAIYNSPQAYGCYNLDKQIRSESSSGGLFSLFASKVIESGGVVYGAAFNEEFDVEHIGITEENELYKLRGSKYVQSNLGQTYLNVKKILDQDRLVYFSGTPCQIDGLLCFLDKQYNNLICQDIICHGVPSPKIWREYKKDMSLKNNDIITEIQFRNKANGWDEFNMVIKFGEKQYINCHNNDPYMKIFLNNLCLRPSCYACSSKSIHRKSDITLGDFWGVKEICPQLYDNEGTSIVIINSDKGEKIFNEINNNINFQKVDLDQVIKSNTALIKSVAMPKQRSEFFKAISGDNNFNSILNKYTRIPTLRKIKNKIIKLIRRCCL